jgi:uncharacterized protein YecE (DUF72 family)
MKKPQIKTGLAAYNNSSWTGIFYPEGLPASGRFEYYCNYFGMYEINATFYRFPTLKSLRAWHAKSPDDFIFSVKAPKIITHLKKFIDCKTEIEAFYAVCREGLAAKLGTVLFQLPPGFSYSPERLTLIVSSLDPAFDNVVEYRHESWWIQEVYDSFRAHNITFCSVSYPRLPTLIIVTTATVYVRLHGVPKLFYSGYSPAELKKLQEAITEAKPRKAFVIFNNTAGTEGIKNTLAFKALQQE